MVLEVEEFDIHVHVFGSFCSFFFHLKMMKLSNIDYHRKTIENLKN